MTGRLRADLLLVQRGIFETRARAQAAIRAGGVTIGGTPVRGAAERFAPDAAIEASPAHPYVSRGGVKLAAALDCFGLSPAGCICLDCGASTGGFTDVLLRRGAAQVYAVDTGSGQLHAAIRRDTRVIALESTDIRRMESSGLQPAPTFAAIDVSFISLRLVLPAVARLMAAPATLVALIKPQFEVGRAFIGKGGIVRDEPARQEAIESIRAALAGLGYQEHGLIDSPIAGGDGNREMLIAAWRGR